MQSKTVIALLLARVALCPVAALGRPAGSRSRLGRCPGERGQRRRGYAAGRLRRLDRNHSERAHRRGRFSAHNRSVEG